MYYVRILCPFAVYYLRYAVRPFFTMSRISVADGKRAGQKVQRTIAAAVQKVKSPLLFVPLFWNYIRQKEIITNNVPLFKKLRDLIFFFCGIRGGEIVKREIEEGGCEETFLCLSLTWKTCRFTVPPAVPPVELYKLWYTLADFLPNWDISRGFLYILTINVPLFKKLRDIIEGPWLQKDIKLPMSRCLRNFGT